MSRLSERVSTADGGGIGPRKDDNKLVGGLYTAAQVDPLLKEDFWGHLSMGKKKKILIHSGYSLIDPLLETARGHLDPWSGVKSPII